MPGLAPIGDAGTGHHRPGRSTHHPRRPDYSAQRLTLSSAGLDAAAFGRAVRAHWRIENSMHWVLDVGFDKDRARNRCGKGPENLAILRKLALIVLRGA